MEKEYYKTIYDIAKKYETENAFFNGRGMEEIIRAEHRNNLCTDIYIDAHHIDYMLTVTSHIRITAYSSQRIEFKYSLYCDVFNGDDADEEEYESGNLTIEEFNNRLKEYISLADGWGCLHDLDYFNMLKEIANIGDKT